jgi:hypothetical protein
MSTQTTVSRAFSNADVDSAEDVLIAGVSGFDIMWLTFLVGTANLSAFTVEFRLSEDSDWFTIANSISDYTVPEGPILGASGDLTTALSGSTAHFLRLDVRGVSGVRIKAAGTSSTITGAYSLA